MIKRYSFFGKWRKCDLDFFSKLGIEIELGYFNILLEEGTKLNLLKEHYLNRKSFFTSVKPPEFSFRYVGARFSSKEKDNAENFVLCNNGYPKGYPLCNNDYIQLLNNTYAEVCLTCGYYSKQINPFKISSEPKLSKKQVNFSLNWVHDEMFFKKDFFQEILAPLGLKSREVLVGKSEKISKNIVQLIIPEAKSNLLLDHSAFDTNIACKTCGIKKYSQQILDFMPNFKENFEFSICQTKEAFGETKTFQAMRRLIISKEFCALMVKEKLIKYNTCDISPMINE